jgi:mono/diheme cytochrome c family protein
MRTFGAMMLILMGLASCESEEKKSHAMVERGAYLAAIMVCADCHTPGGLKGQHDWARVYTGSDIPFFMPGQGYFFPPNLTSDADTGLGKWSREQIADAITHGTRPDGRELVPIMPWRFYKTLTREDALALSAYLQSLKPVSNAVPAPVGADGPPPGPYMTIVVPQ